MQGFSGPVAARKVAAAVPGDVYSAGIYAFFFFSVFRSIVKPAWQLKVTATMVVLWRHFKSGSGSSQNECKVFNFALSGIGTFH